MHFSSGCCVNLKLTLGQEPIDSINPDLQSLLDVQTNWAERVPFEGTETPSGDRVFEFEIVHENGLDYGAHMMVNGKPVYRQTTYYDTI